MIPKGASSGSPVLVVDDEELYLRALVADLGRRGFQVTARRDLLAAEAAYREMEAQGALPLLVVDLIQPGENGGYLGGLDLLRRLGLAPGRGTVALADSEAPWLATAARSLGAQRVVLKPDLRRTAPEHLDRALKGFLSEVAGEEADSKGEPDAAAGDPPPAPADVALLGALEELRHAPDRASVLLLVMRLASEMAARGILYEVQGDHLRGLGRFGLDDEAGAAGVATLGLDVDSLPGRAFWSARMQRLAGADGHTLLPPLPGGPPAEAISLPVLGPGGVAAVLYADTGPRPEGRLPDLRPLTALAGTASLALEGLGASHP